MESAIASFLSWVWENTLGAALLCGLAALLVYSGRKWIPPMFRYALWLLVMVRLIWPVAPASKFSAMNLRPTAKPEAMAPIAVVPEPGAEVSVTATEPVVSKETLVPRKVSPSVVLFLIWFLGTASSLLLVCVRHRRLSRWVARQTPSDDPRLLRILTQAQRICSTRLKFDRIVTGGDIAVPAVFRVRKPVLLLPAALATEASDEELLLIMSHELVHVKHGDVLVNWFCIIVRALHWFNPAIWFAWKRLCAEREHVCDAVVLSRINPSRHSVYGNLLIKLASTVMPWAPRSIVIPILQHKPEIHRRIVMISRFKRAPLALTVASGIIVIVLVCLTFTRAAEKPKSTTPPAVTNAPEAAPGRSSTAREFLDREIQRQQEIVRAHRDRVNKIRLELGITSPDEEAGIGAEGLRKLEGMRIEAQAEFKKLQGLYIRLTNMTQVELRRALPTALPDQQLSTLLGQLDSTEQKLADVVENYAKDHPDVKRLQRVLSQIQMQVNDRVVAILAGLELKMTAESTHMNELAKEVAKRKEQVIDRSLRTQPYEETLRALRLEETILERLRLRALQEQIDSALPQSKQ